VELSLDQDQEDLRAVVADLLADRAGPAAVRAASESEPGHDAALWSLLAGELGLVGLAVPAEHGGAGASFVEVAVVLEQLGARLVPSPYASTVTVLQVLLRHAGADARVGLSSGPAAGLASGLVAGTTTAAVALVEPGDRSWPPRVGCRAVADADERWRLTGTKSTVLDAVGADLLLVSAQTDGEVALFAVDPADPGVRRVPVVLVDQTRRAADVSLEDAPAVRVGGPAAVADARHVAAVVRAVEAVGSARRCLELTVDHLATRVQFGRPLGSFQALRHRAADLFTTVEAATSTARWAAASVAGGGADLAVVGPLAQTVCVGALEAVAAESVQLHGGIAITWEHDAQRYLKRAAGLALTGGTAAQLRRCLAGAAGLA
jgi:alkylation response protein AidB-like acyl-CoA dehydrogenase